MIQDIWPQKLKNEYIEKEVSAESLVVIFRNREVLIRRNEEEELFLPTYRELSEQGRLQGMAERLQYLFSVGSREYFLYPSWEREAEEITGYHYENVRILRQMISKEVCFGVMTAFHLFVWYRDNRFCGRCASSLQHDHLERMLRCPSCGNMVYPKIAPAVIVALTDGDKILMTRYADREYKKYALLAGFTEIGETAEETVQREVMEEVGLKVKNIRYYKSQPWGVDSNLLLGYFAELDGDSVIQMDEKELAVAEWFSREEMPAHNDGISLTREMMGAFESGEYKSIK